MLFVVRKNQLLLKIKNSTVLIIFEMISLKWVKSLTNLKQPGFSYRVCGLFTKHRERTQKLRETGNLKYLYRNELGKACFVYDTAYSYSKDLAKTSISDKILKDRAYEISRNRRNCRHQRVLTSAAYKFVDTKTGYGVSANEQLAEELYKPVIKKFKRRKVCARFKDNIWAADLAEMESLSSKKNVKYLLFDIDVLTKYAWVKPLKYKKVKPFSVLLTK